MLNVAEVGLFGSFHDFPLHDFDDKSVVPQ